MGSPPRTSPHLPALLVAGLLVSGCGGGRPHEVRWEVLGDALVVSFEGGDAATRLESEREVVRLPADPPPGRRQLVLRGLPATEDLTVRLVWEGGRTGPQDFRAGPAAVRGVPRLAGRGRIRVNLGRYCELRSPGGRWRELAPGEVQLALPEDGPGREVALEVREGGLEFRLAWPWAEVVRSSTDRLLSALAGLDEPAHLRDLSEAPDPAVEARSADGAKRAFADLFPWLPRLLRDELGRGRGRAVLQALERFQRLAAYERSLGLPGRVPGARPDLPGERPNGFPPWPGAEVRRISMRPEGQIRELKPSRSFYMGVKLDDLGNRFAATLKSFRPRNAVTELHWSWPPDAPRSGADMAIGIRVDHLVRETQLRLVSHGEGEEPLDLRLWHPAVARTSRPRYSGWLTVDLPAELAPRPGEAMHLELAPLLRVVYQGNEIRDLQVAWRTREGQD